MAQTGPLSRGSDSLHESLARRLYVLSGGDESVFPWPCRGADRYRTLAAGVIAWIMENSEAA